MAYCYTPVSSGTCSGVGGNNGQITQIKDNTGTDQAGRTVEYTYDALGRLSTALTEGSPGPTGYSQWGLSWVYDRYGNRKEQNVTAGSPPAPTLPIDPATNRINEVADPAYGYDNAGNMIKDGSGSTFTYDAEGRITGQGGTITAAYTYDGGGFRVKKEVPAVSPTTTTRYIYSGAKVVAEYENGAAVGSPTREYVYLGAQLLATLEGGTTTYHHPDHLSVRASTDSTGAIPAGGEQGHYPFGEEWYKGAAGTRTQFTSYERDSESGLDYAMFRYDSSMLGRFMTPDPIAGNLFNPQRLNRYTYTLNDPINLIDPLGLNHCSLSERRDNPERCKHEPRCTNGNSPGRGDCDPIPTGPTPTPPPGTCIEMTVNGFATNNCDPPITVEIERPIIECDPRVAGIEACKKKEKGENLANFNACVANDEQLKNQELFGAGVEIGAGILLIEAGIYLTGAVIGVGIAEATAASDAGAIFYTVHTADQALRVSSATSGVGGIPYLHGIYKATEALNAFDNVISACQASTGYYPSQQGTTPIPSNIP